MVKIDIFRNTEKLHDIIILDMERYMSWTAFEYACSYLCSRLPLLKDCEIDTCLEYKGIAFKHSGLLENLPIQKQDILSVANDLLDFLDD